MTGTSIFDRIAGLLRSAGAEFTRIEHHAVYTSEQAARARGTSLHSGAKALICKGESGLAMFVLPADRKLDGKLVRQCSGWRKFRFATREEVAEVTGLAPGSIPPFGSLFGLSTFCDRALQTSDCINFNAGHHEISISMSYDDYIRVEDPIVHDLSTQERA